MKNLNPRRKLSERKKAKIRRLFAEGLNRAEIARKIKRSWFAVHSALYPETVTPPKHQSWHDLNPKEKARKNAMRNDWVKRNRKRVLFLQKLATRRYRKRQKANKLERKKLLVIEIGKRLGLYENHR